jgi:predicted Zn-dependent protease
MNRIASLRLAGVFFLTVVLLLTPLKPAWGFLDELIGSLTIEKERQIGEEFFLAMQQAYPLVQDPFLTSYINRLGKKLVAPLGPQAFKYRFFIIVDPSLNAFAVPGGYVFITTGMIRMMEREGELAGVLAHEISHIYGRHMARQMEKAKFTNIAILVGAMAAIFLGGAALAEPLLVGTMAAGESAMLKYSRDFEREADALGFKWMIKAGYNPRDMMSIFKKMNRQRWFEGGKVPQYLSTHPDVDSRLVDLAHQMTVHQDKLPPGADNPEFQFFSIRLEAICGNPHQLLRRMNQDSAREPQNPAFLYGRALALASLDKTDEAVAAFQQALKMAPGNHLIQRDLAITYFDRNRYSDAQPLLDDLSRRFPHDDVALYYLGRIHQERRQADQALSLFEKVHNLNPTFIEVYYNLGTLYGEKGQLGLAHYYLGFHSLKAKAYPTALFHFRKALQHLPPGDSRYAEVQRQVTRLQRHKVRVAN